MAIDPIRFMKIDDTGDQRGSSFSLPKEWSQFLPNVADAHITTLRPGHTRGNHYHVRHKEILVVLFSDRWTFYWDSGAETQKEKREFQGEGAVLVEVEPGASHAVLNSGKEDLLIIGLSDLTYDPVNPDASPRAVIS